MTIAPPPAPASPSLTLLHVAGARYVELKSARRHLAVLDERPELVRPPAEVMAEYVEQLRRRARRSEELAGEIESDLRAAK